MRFFLKTFVLPLAAILIVAMVFLNVLVDRIARSEEFRGFAEQKIGEYLKAKVNIGEIRRYGFTQIALEKIIIESSSAPKGSRLIRLERLIFRYDLSQLWNRRLSAPSSVVLKNPLILIDQDQFPYSYFEKEPGASTGFSMPSLDFNGGEIRYSLPSIGKEILLTAVKGTVTPSPNQEIRIDIRGKVAGFLDGKVRIYGAVHPVKKTHDLWLEVKGTSFSKDIPLPFEDVEGKIHWVGQDLFFEGVRATLHGWETELSGSFEHDENGFPEMTCHLRAGQKEPWLKFDFSLNLGQQKFEGSLQPAAERGFKFIGKVRQDAKRFVMDSLQVDPSWNGRGELDFSSGNYELSLENGAQRFAVHSNLQGLEFAIYFHFDHLKLSQLDVVTQGKVFLHSVSRRWRGKDFMLKGNLETDYFILGQQPFEDLKAAFEISPYGVTGIRTSWGKEFQMTGQMPFGGKAPQTKFLLRVKNFDLGHVQEFASKPLPKEMGGILDGKLEIEGALAKPEIIGTFNIHDGKWGRLHYDRGIIQFRGVPPYFPLKDSKIWKGRSTFSLTGAVDLTLDNVFSGVKIETPDHLVIWKGLEAVLHEKDRSLEVSRTKVGAWGEFSTLEATATEHPLTGSSAKPTDSHENEQVVTVGPKLKF